MRSSRSLYLGSTRPEVEQALMEAAGDEADEQFAATFWEMARRRKLIVYDPRCQQFRWSHEAAKILEDEPRWLSLLDEVARLADAADRS
jgi:hypothetical protein